MENPFSGMLAHLKGNNFEDQILVLSGTKFPVFTAEIKNKITETEDTTTILLLRDCDLQSLDDFPMLKDIHTIDLGQNKLDGSELVKLVDKVPACQVLFLDGNNIKEYSELEPLVKLEELIELNFMNTPLSEKEDYRDKVFELFPNLEILDDMDRNGEKVERGKAEIGENAHGCQDGEGCTCGANVQQLFAALFGALNLQMNEDAEDAAENDEEGEAEGDEEDGGDGETEGESSK